MCRTLCHNSGFLAPARTRSLVQLRAQGEKRNTYQGLSFGATWYISVHGCASAVLELTRWRSGVRVPTSPYSPNSDQLFEGGTDGKHWDDKPRWSPDGKKIYFVSGRTGFFNVWGINFDSSKGRPVGEPFRVTAFENPAMMLADWIPNVELSLTQDKLVLTMEERSGSVWLLDNVNR